MCSTCSTGTPLAIVAKTVLTVQPQKLILLHFDITGKECLGCMAFGLKRHSQARTHVGAAAVRCAFCLVHPSCRFCMHLLSSLLHCRVSRLWLFLVFVFGTWLSLGKCRACRPRVSPHQQKLDLARSCTVSGRLLIGPRSLSVRRRLAGLASAYKRVQPAHL